MRSILNWFLFNRQIYVSTEKKCKAININFVFIKQTKSLRDGSLFAGPWRVYGGIDQHKNVLRLRLSCRNRLLAQKELLEFFQLEKLLRIFRIEAFGVGDIAEDWLITWQCRDDGKDNQQDGKELQSGEKLLQAVALTNLGGNDIDTLISLGERWRIWANIEIVFINELMIIIHKSPSNVRSSSAFDNTEAMVFYLFFISITDCAFRIRFVNTLASSNTIIKFTMLFVRMAQCRVISGWLLYHLINLHALTARFRNSFVDSRASDKSTRCVRWSLQMGKVELTKAIEFIVEMAFEDDLTLTGEHLRADTLSEWWSSYDRDGLLCDRNANFNKVSIMIWLFAKRTASQNRHSWSWTINNTVA